MVTRAGVGFKVRQVQHGGIRSRVGPRSWGIIALCIIFGLLSAFLVARPALAFDNYQFGHISRVSFVPNAVLIMLDNGIPTNCTGTPAGWLMINASSAPIVAFVTGLWMRGDASQVQLAVYTSGIDSTSFCQVSQIDTQSAG